MRWISDTEVVVYNKSLSLSLSSCFSYKSLSITWLFTLHFDLSLAFSLTWRLANWVTWPHSIVPCLCLQTRSDGIPNPDQLGKVADKFLLQSLSSDVSFLYPPSQVLAACWSNLLPRDPGPLLLTDGELDTLRIEGPCLGMMLGGCHEFLQQKSTVFPSDSIGCTPSLSQADPRGNRWVSWNSYT